MHVGYVLHSPSRKESWATAGQAIVAASMMVRIIGFLALFYRSLITQFLELVATAQERDALFARQATLEARINSQNGERAQLSAAEALLRELHDRAEGADNSVRRQVIETLVQQATVMVGEDRAVNLDVTYRFEEPGDIAYISSLAVKPSDAPGPA